MRRRRKMRRRRRRRRRRNYFLLGRGPTVRECGGGIVKARPMPAGTIAARRAPSGHAHARPTRATRPATTSPIGENLEGLNVSEFDVQCEGAKRSRGDGPRARKEEMRRRGRGGGGGRKDEKEEKGRNWREDQEYGGFVS
ncbi:unnamed protein product [Prorocentrum cordatum]|uniref:Uncharacterized protein n=1 Tax=Prorocentrum cordatum TaxID=2364126 RepID=A0ABN9RDB3_9DINO|nr:unnamed protein product [Polarella glacialis]